MSEFIIKLKILSIILTNWEHFDTAAFLFIIIGTIVLGLILDNYTEKPVIESVDKDFLTLKNWDKIKGVKR